MLVVAQEERQEGRLAEVLPEVRLVLALAFEERALGVVR